MAEVVNRGNGSNYRRIGGSYRRINTSRIFVTLATNRQKQGLHRFFYLIVASRCTLVCMKVRVPPVAWHIMCCLAFLALPYVFAPGSFSRLGDLAANQHERTNLIIYGLMLLFFYANYYVLIPRLYFSRRYVVYCLSVVGCFGLIIGVLLTIDRQDIVNQFTQLPASADPPPPFSAGQQQGYFRLPGNKPPVGFELNLALYLFLVGLFVSLALRTNSRLRESEKARLSTELSYLKAQINPHFLFNTLNSIYALTLEKSDEAPDAVARLSALMRYVLGEATGDRVPLNRDMEYICNYVALQQTRLADTVIIDFQINGSRAELTIAPLILISFIENAFKYGVNPESTSEIMIEISVQESQLHMSVWNAKVRRVMADDSSFGIGISNTATRLTLLYPDQHQLLIHDEPNSFGVELTIDL